MSAAMSRFGLCSSLRASNPSSSSSPPSLSFLLPPSCLLLHRLPSSSTSPISNRAYSTTISSRPTPISTTSSKRSLSTSPSSFATPPTSNSTSDMLRDTANQKRERDAQQSTFIRDWAAMQDTKEGKKRIKTYSLGVGVWYNPDSWISHFRTSLSPSALVTRIRMDFNNWMSINSDLQRSLGRTEPAEQKLGLFPWTAEYKLQIKNRDAVLAQVQKAYDKFRVVEIRCDTKEDIDEVSLSSANKELIKKFKDPRRNQKFVTAKWERTMDHAKPKIISLVNSPFLPQLNLSSRTMLVELDFQEKITLKGQVIDQRTKTTVLFEQRSWSEKDDEWKVRKRNVQKDPFGLMELGRE